MIDPHGKSNAAFVTRPAGLYPPPSEVRDATNRQDAPEHSLRRLLRPLFVVLLIACCAVGRAERAESEEKLPDFQPDVAPLLQKYCYGCHGAEKQRGGVALHKYRSIEAMQADRGTWTSVIEAIESEAMPPEDQPRPSVEERARMVELLERSLFHLDCEKVRDPGRVTIRRLNRAEYNNTVRDLLAVELTPADDFPSDDVGEGFDNIGDVLSLPPLLMEKYLDAAETLATAAIVDRSPDSAPRVKRERQQLSSEGGVRMDEYGVYALYSSGEVSGPFDLPRDGEYLLRVEAGAQQAGDEPARLELRLDGRKLQVFDVKAPANNPEFFEHKLKVTGGKHRLSGAFINDYYNPQAANPKDRDRNLYIRSLEVVGPLDFRAEDLPPSHRQLVRVRPGEGRGVEQAAREVLQPFVRRAFRRPARPGEVERYVQLVKMVVDKGESYEHGLRVAVAGVLVSPHFLFRVEQDPAPDDPDQTHPLNDYELASRLSYFLWSSMPDERLFELAEAGTLHRDDVLRTEVARMLRSEKAQALVENFGGQWLNLRNLDGVTPDPTRFPEFDEDLKRAMRKETELFFASVMREDRSLLDFLTADFTFVNERLAQHYGLKEVAGEDFRRVVLDGNRRRGILTHASVLTLTSNPTRTSPVKRGKWILENILGTPPPDPPPNVPELEEAQTAAPDASLREQLELHSRDPGCAVCHRKMDALGFGLENFDAVGRWRDRDGSLPVDATGSLPGGVTFRGPAEMAEYLAGQKEPFSRALAGKMLTYALGRGLEFYDRCAIDKIVEALEPNDYRFSVLVTEIVKSEPFRMRRGEGDES